MVAKFKGRANFSMEDKLLTTVVVYPYCLKQHLPHCIVRTRIKKAKVENLPNMKADTDHLERVQRFQHG